MLKKFLGQLKPPTIFFLIYILSVPFESLATVYMYKNSSFSTYIAGFAGAAAVIYIISKPKVLKLTKASVVWIVFFIWCLIALLWTPEQKTSLAWFVYKARFLFFYLAMSSYPFNKSELRAIRHALVASGMIAGLAILTTYDKVITGGFLRSTLFLGEYSADPNHLSAALLLPFSFVITDILTSKGAVRIWDYFALILIFAGIFLTGSRGSAIAVIVMLIFFLIKIQPIKKLSRTLITSIMGLAILASVLIFLSPGLAQRFVTFNVKTDQFSSGRTKVWVDSLELWKEKPILGWGTNSFPYLEIEKINIYQAAHNIFIHHLVELGIIGLVILLFAVYTNLSFKARTPFSAASKAGLIGVLVASLFLHTIFYDYFWLALIMAEISNRSKGHEET